MILKEKIFWEVGIIGKILIQAVDGDQALAQAKEQFKKMDEHVGWSLNQTKAFVDVTEAVPVEEIP